MSFFAMSFAALFARLRVFTQSLPPIFESLTGFSSPPPVYFDTRSSCVAGTYSVSVPA